MNIFALISIISALASFIVGEYVWIKNPRSRLNLLFLLIAASFLLISLADAALKISWFYNQAFFWGRVRVIFWGVSLIFLLNFAIVFSEKEELLSSKLFKIAIYLPFAILSYLIVATPFMFSGIKEFAGGLQLIYRPAFDIYFLFILLLIFLNLYFNFKVWSGNYRKVKKEQARIILVGYAVVLVFFALPMGILFPMFGFINFSSVFSAPTVLIVLTSYSYSILRHGFLVLTPASAANEILKIMPDALFLISSENKIARVNLAASRLLDYGVDEIIGFPIDAVFENIDPAKIVRDGGIRNHDINLINKMGQNISASLSGSVLKDRGGEVIGMVCIAKDMRLYKEIDRMKNEFVSKVSHELKTPLSIVREGISIVLDELYGKVNADQKNLLEVAKVNIDRLTHLINELLDVSKIEARKIELRRRMVSVNKIIKDVIRDLGRDASIKKVVLKVDSSLTDHFVIFVDPNMLFEIIRNLVHNAVKFSPDRGVVVIEVSQGEDLINVQVIDQGPGIPKEDIGEIFSKFKKINPMVLNRRRGAGLGLPITKALIELHGGRIWVESRPGEGSKFCFTIPIIDDKIAQRT